MLSRRSSKTENPSVSIRSTFGSYFLRALLVLSLIYYIVLVFDLFLHPFALGVGYDAFFVERFLSRTFGHWRDGGCGFHHATCAR